MLFGIQNSEIRICEWIRQMVATQTEIESRVVELASEALEAFCEDISGMFGVAMECEQQEIATQTVAQLKKRFKKLVAVNIVDSEGILDGTFQLIFDQEGLFTLGGIMVMLPEKRILANRKDASADLAESMVDAVGEAGNLLVGAWERIFREELEGHGHLLQRLPAFVGKPWDKPQEKIGLSPEEEHIFIPYEMTISPYPAFNCGVILPRAIFEGKSETDSDDAAPEKADAAQESRQEPEAAEAKDSDEPKAADAKKKEEDAKPAAKKSEPGKSKAARKKPTKKVEPDQPADEEKPATEATAAPEPANETPDKEDNASDKDSKAESPEAVEEKDDSAQSDETQQDNAEEASKKQAEASAEQTDSGAKASEDEDPDQEQDETTEASEEAATGPVSGAIKELARSQINGTSELLWVSAKDIMKTKVVWVSPDESVQQALMKLQQNDVGYLAVGSGEVLEGIVSKSDVAGAMSPYLRPMFARWRKPSDDATLNIKLKWIMSRPVRTAKPDTPLATMLENMCRFGGRALPVVDEQGKVHGLVTAFDIFQVLLNLGADVPTAGNVAQGPPL